ncbi:MAG: 16S rRNA (cytosine(1402)-N(4))-methyltransferase RsmH [Aphanocapsa feldmannii 277cI]|uniref:Ribosomal RNA small subunit methyltransferase H n=1 Tax=Aphanocapsa feldmannii 277cI TaxID=2507554 RepID=A0A524RU71_9CHRO|nr:MAG: 16S rRNA (cytosine(1402)-N(4))-methyltransferase RsmH [Aphanocapsa feldmannii 277cI]
MCRRQPVTSASTGTYEHRPVLEREVLQGFAGLPLPGRLLDCTLGGGGHSRLLLEAHPGLTLVGLDQDPGARAAATRHLDPLAGRWQIVAGNFGAFIPAQPFSGVLADLGVSSPQLDGPGRGFSFRHDGPLDMRMNPDHGETAAQLIDRLDEQALANLIHTYGEERYARRIARRLVEQRPLQGTAVLAQLVARCYPPKRRHGRIHPATRTFQALRIAVNRELEVLERLLRDAPDWLVPGGVIGIISFHSLEDRLVKRAFLADPRLQRLTRKPIMTSEREAKANPRSRSARLRLACRCGHATPSPLSGGGSADGQGKAGPSP